MSKTHNGAEQYEHSLNHALEFFSKAGAAFTKKQAFYGNEETAKALFQKSWIVDPYLSFQLLLWLRDCRGGAGNRSGFRDCLTWLAKNDPAWVKANVQQIPEVGRWDDLLSLYDTPCEKEALRVWGNGIMAQHGLACKWADRQDVKLRAHLGFSEKKFRRMCVEGTKVVETQMCARQWGSVEYPKVPSVAMSRYTNAFKRHDQERFDAFKTKVEKGEEKINAGALYPHDCLRTAIYGDGQIAEAQWKALPNFMGDTDERILCLCDASGSMGINVSGSVEAIDISVSLSLYCSDRLGPENPFYRKFIEFESESHFIDWRNKSLYEARRMLSGHCGSTNIQAALANILYYAIKNHVRPDQMPTKLLIISDMQFDQGARGEYNTGIEAVMGAWSANGYKTPGIVYWNLSSNVGSPATAKTPNTALVSGFSPSLLKSILGGQDFRPMAIMKRALAKYVPNVPVNYIN